MKKDQKKQIISLKLTQLNINITKALLKYSLSKFSIKLLFAHLNFIIKREDTESETSQ